MDRLKAMAIFMKVAEAGSFSAASRALRMPLATVSRKVGDLEVHLGASLLLRTTRKVSLTEAGASYLAAARRILDEVDETERIVAGEYNSPRGELVLTAPLFFGRLHVVPIVADFLAAYPEIDVRLLLSDRNLHLLDDHVDLAVRIGMLPDSRMVATHLGSMRTVVCASPGFLRRHGVPKKPQDVAAVPGVGFEFLSPASVWSFSEAGKRIEVPIRPRLSVTTAEAAVSAAAAGVGPCRVLHYQCADLVREGLLRVVLEDFEVDPLPVHIVHAGSGALPSKTRVFLDFAAGRLRIKLASL